MGNTFSRREFVGGGLSAWGAAATLAQWNSASAASAPDHVAVPSSRIHVVYVGASGHAWPKP